jgi:hypothetical protein
MAGVAARELGGLGEGSWQEIRKEFPKGVGKGAAGVGETVPWLALAGLLVTLDIPLGELAALVPALKGLADRLKAITGRDKNSLHDKADAAPKEAPSAAG